MLSKLKNFLLGSSSAFDYAPLQPQIFHLGGESLKDSSLPKFDEILVIDDIPRYAHSSLDIIKKHYQSSKLTVYIAYTYESALATFNDNNIKLVILDLDLDDESGDGEMLIKDFISQNASLIVLANSSKKKFNDILLNNGATFALGKRSKSLRLWLKKNDS